MKLEEEEDKVAALENCSNPQGLVTLIAKGLRRLFFSFEIELNLLLTIVCAQEK